MRKLLLLIALLSAGGCKAADEKPAAAENSDLSADRDYIAEVKALPEARRKALFFRAIRDAGLPCQTVTKAEPVDANEKAPTWRAECEDRSAHLVRVMPDGTLYVTSRVTP
ncbi:hypothetical protein [Sphingopyxis chilensis]